MPTFYETQSSSVGIYGLPNNAYSHFAIDPDNKDLIISYGDAAAIRVRPDDTAVLYLPTESSTSATWCRYIGCFFDITGVKLSRAVKLGNTLELLIPDGPPVTKTTPGTAYTKTVQPTKYVKYSESELVCSPAVTRHSAYNPRWILPSPAPITSRATDLKKVTALRKKIRDNWALQKASVRLLGDNTRAQFWNNPPEIQNLYTDRRARATALFCGLKYEEYKFLSLRTKTADAVMAGCLTELYVLAGCYL